MTSLSTDQNSMPYRLLTGGGRFVGDLIGDDTLHCWFVRSPIAHGVLNSIETEAARQAPGVVAVFTADDLALPKFPSVMGFGPEARGMERPPLARGRVRFVGEALALVVAETARQGEDAAGLIWADIDPLDVVADIDAALADETILFPERGTNIVNTNVLEEGPEPTSSELVEVSVVVDHHRLAPSPIEPLSILVEPADETLRVWVGHQSPHQLRTDLSHFLGLEPEAIRITVPDVGGAFGMKRLYPEYVIVAAASRALELPLAWRATRREMFLTGTHGRSQRHRVTLVAEGDGRIRHARFELTTDTGAYPHRGSQLAAFARSVAIGLYDIPSIEFATTICVTNRTPTGPYRGAGRPEAALAIERAISALAAELEIDAADIRRRNMVRAFPYHSPTGVIYDSGDYVTALDRALDLVDYEGVRREQQRRREVGENPLGIGIGAFVERAGGAVDSGEYGSTEVTASGEVIVRSGSTSAGQHQEPILEQIAASVLTVPPEAITVVAGDTMFVPQGVGSFGSRSTQVGASAVMRTAEQVRDGARHLAAELIEASAEDLTLSEGAFRVVGVPNATVTLAEVAAAADDRGEPLRAEEFFVPGAQTFPYGVHIAVVDVSLVTGAVTLLRLVTVDDVGSVIDKRGVEGQLHGSLMQGVAAALFEGVEYDEYGQPITTSFVDYLVPQAGTRLHLTSDRMETPAPSNPLGAKGAGEGGTIGAPPAILNAAIDALRPYGVTDLQIPLQPHRVWEALTNARV